MRVNSHCVVCRIFNLAHLAADYNHLRQLCRGLQFYTQFDSAAGRNFHHVFHFFKPYRRKHYGIISGRCFNMVQPTLVGDA